MHAAAIGATRKRSRCAEWTDGTGSVATGAARRPGSTSISVSLKANTRTRDCLRYWLRYAAY